jgi:hypothetical protein
VPLYIPVPAALLLLLCSGLLSAPSSAASSTTSAPPAEIEAAIDMAHGAPGEFAADALLRIAALESLDSARRILLVEEAFSRAAEAQQPFKRRSAMQRFSSNAGFVERAFGQDLDALSLRTRAVQAMLPLDAGKARRLFLDIPPVDLPLVPCGNFLVFDVDRYYDALAAVEQRAFTPKEAHDGAPYQFLLQGIATMAAPAQVAPAARAILSSSLSGAEFPGAVAAFTAALKKMVGDDRSFTYSLPAAGAQVLALIEECQRRRTSPLPLVEAYRLYLTSNFSLARCADDDLLEASSMAGAPGYGQTLDQRSADAIRFFNQRIRMTPLQPIQPTEAAASSRVGAAGGLRSCESAECRAIALQYRSLVFNSSGSALPSAGRETVEWQERFQQFLGALAKWEDASGPEGAQQFREKCAFYGDLIGLSPSGSSREEGVRAMLEFLQRSRWQANSRMEWFLPVNALIGRVGLEPLGWGHLADDLYHSKDAVIALYAQLEKVAPRAAPDILQLM